MADLGKLTTAVAEVVGPAVATFAMTALSMAFLGGVLATAGYVIAAHGSIPRGLIAAALGLAAAVGLSMPLAAKRAISRAIVLAVERHHLAESTVRWIFDRILVPEMDSLPPGERGGALAKAVERVPLAEAERRLTAAVNLYLNAIFSSGSGAGARIRAGAQRVVVGWIERFTLARLRQDSSAAGVDLVKTREDLAGTADDAVIDRVESSVRNFTLVVAIGTTSVALIGAWLIGHLPI